MFRLVYEVGSHSDLQCPHCRNNFDVEWDEEVYEKTYDVECPKCLNKFQLKVWVEEHYEVISEPKLEKGKHIVTNAMFGGEIVKVTDTFVYIRWVNDILIPIQHYSLGFIMKNIRENNWKIY